MEWSRVHPSGWKRGASRPDGDIVSSFAEMQSSSKKSACRLTNYMEETCKGNGYVKATNVESLEDADFEFEWLK